MAQIVVGVDGSKDSESALRWAASEARLRGASLRIVHAMHTQTALVPFESSAAMPLSEELREDGNALLDEAATVARKESPGLEVETELILEPAVTSILARSKVSDLAVVGSRGLGSLGAAFLGSVSTRVAARSACPTVVVRPDHSGDPAGPVVVGVDGSRQSEAAFQVALTEAALRNARILALCAYQVPPVTIPLQNAVVIDDLATYERASAKRRLDDVISRYDPPAGVEITAEAVLGEAAHILSSASENASLVALGSRGRGAVLGMLLGSVSQRVLHAATCPVVVVHRDGDDGEGNTK